MKVIRNYLYNVGYQVLAIIVPLITSAYVSRVLRPEGVGANAFTNSIIQYFILFASMGIGYYGNRQIAYVRDNRTKMAKTFWEIQIVKTIMTLVSIIAFEIFLIFYTRQFDYMLAQSLNLIAVAFDISWFYEGIENFKVTVLKNSLVKIVSMIAIFLFIKGPYDVTLYIVVLALSTLLGNLTLWPDIYRDLPKIKVKSLNPWIHFLPMVELFIPQIATQVYVQLNRTMLGVMVNETASGYYQYSDNLVKLILALVTATGTVMLPHVANAVSRGNMEKVNQMLYKSFDFVSAIAIPMMFGLAAISLTLAPKYYGPGYGPVGPAMMIESIVILMIAWSNALGVQYLLPIHHQKQFTISVTVGALINIILNFPLIHFYGLNGAMWSTVLSEIGVTMYQLIAVRGLLSYRILFSGLWKYIISGVVMFLPVFWMNTHLQDSWLMMGLEVIVGVVIYVAMVIVLRVPIVNETRNLIINRLQSKKTH
ncbi:MAG: polysaccharide biosynthesis C-terminal domain-containing protein [Lactobacillus crispatus]|uniref:oligosaccharide flippase family protein n=1 Tax=Lactobacillus crispatus TaxID=47770 RepID=UPI0025515C82|nr:polysaccharide biosynthesis C-terminal domain-containing protein [Lactobacillus crispatus]MDK6377409.1 polysaccharide biosynthesis C-terminal domain-containing protein [Lactobacillus crispatus]MDK8508621.1 polysaccharide biosynthesis C-terminal domain-containing protein [Lactobacillus crispatus]